MNDDVQNFMKKTDKVLKELLFWNGFHPADKTCCALINLIVSTRGLHHWDKNRSKIKKLIKTQMEIYTGLM